jgi:hypothetical protein
VFDVALMLYYIVLQVLQVLSAALPDVQLAVKIATKPSAKQLANMLSQASAKHHSDAPTVLHTLALIAQQSNNTTSSTAHSDSSAATAQQQRCIGKHFAAVACSLPAAAVTGTNCRVTADPLMNRYDAGHVTGHVLVPLCTASRGSSLGVLETSSFTTAQYEVIIIAHTSLHITIRTRVEFCTARTAMLTTYIDVHCLFEAMLCMLRAQLR